VVGVGPGWHDEEPPPTPAHKRLNARGCCFVVAHHGLAQTNPTKLFEPEGGFGLNFDRVLEALLSPARENQPPSHLLSPATRFVGGLLNIVRWPSQKWMRCVNPCAMHVQIGMFPTANLLAQVRLLLPARYAPSRTQVTEDSALARTASLFICLHTSIANRVRPTFRSSARRFQWWRSGENTRRKTERRRKRWLHQKRWLHHMTASDATCK